MVSCAEPMLTNELSQISQFDFLTRAEKDTGVAVPAVIPVKHERKTPRPFVQHVHGTHIDAQAALVAAFFVDFDPGV